MNLAIDPVAFVNTVVKNVLHCPFPMRLAIDPVARVGAPFPLFIFNYR
jgi:hypothetical protein